MPLPRAASEGPLLACYRPLLFYALTEAVALWTHCKLARMGYATLGVTPPCAYYILPGG